MGVCNWEFVIGSWQLDLKSTITFVPSRLRSEKINNKEVKIRNKEVVAPSIPQRGKWQTFRAFAPLRALNSHFSAVKNS